MVVGTWHWQLAVDGWQIAASH